MAVGLTPYPDHFEFALESLSAGSQLRHDCPAVFGRPQVESEPQKIEGSLSLHLDPRFLEGHYFGLILVDFQRESFHSALEGLGNPFGISLFATNHQVITVPVHGRFIRCVRPNLMGKPLV